MLGDFHLMQDMSEKERLIEEALIHGGDVSKLL